MAYSDKVIDHYENPRNVGSFDKGDDTVGTGMVGAPACGGGLGGLNPGMSTGDAGGAPHRDRSRAAGTRRCTRRGYDVAEAVLRGRTQAR